MWLVGELDDRMKKLCQGLVTCMDKMKLEHLIQSFTMVDFVHSVLTERVQRYHIIDRHDLSKINSGI